MKDNNGTRQACSGAIGAAGLLAFATACAGVPPAATASADAGTAPGFPLLSEAYPGFFSGGGSPLVVDETQPGTVVYYSYREGYAGWPATLSLFPNGRFTPYGYFGYPYRYRPYGTYPRRPRPAPGNTASPDPGWQTGCGGACGTTGDGPGLGSALTPAVSEPPGRRVGRGAAPLQIGPQPPAVGPQPPAVGPRLVGPRGWQGLRPR